MDGEDVKIMKNRIKRIAAWFVFILTCRGSIAAEAERAGICDFSGQGKNSSSGGKL